MLLRRMSTSYYFGLTKLTKLGTAFAKNAMPSYSLTIIWYGGQSLNLESASPNFRNVILKQLISTSEKNNTM